MLDKSDYYEERGKPMPTRAEIHTLSIFFRAVLILVAPAQLLIYYFRLVTLDAYLHAKKQRKLVRKNGPDEPKVPTYKAAWFFQILFCCSRMRTQNYIEYVQYRNKKMESYGRWAEIVTVCIILIIVFFYLWNETIDEFKLPWFYLYLVCMLLAQKQVTFILKVILFFPIYGASRFFCPTARHSSRR